MFSNATAPFIYFGGRDRDGSGPRGQLVVGVGREVNVEAAGGHEVNVGAAGGCKGWDVG